MNQKKAKQRQAYDYLYYVIRAAVLLSVVFLFIPSLNPARISGMINKNLSLFTSGISYSTLTNGFGRAFKKGWVSQESFMLDCAGAIVMCVGIASGVAAACMSLGNIRLKKHGKTTYGVSLFADWDGDMVMFVKSTASAYFGYDEFGIGLYDSDKQEYHPCLEENGPYLTALKFYNTLYQKGLLDPDSQTQGYDGMVEDYQNGTAFMNVFNFLGSSLYNSEAHTSEGKMMAPCPPAEAEPIAYGQNIYGGNRPWTIGANTEYPELCMAIINWLATPEGRMTLEYGPKDVCWYYDEDGNTCFTDLGKSAKLDGKTEMSDGYSGTFEDGNFKINNTTWALDTTNLDSKVGETYNYKRWSSFNSAAGSEIEQDWRDHNNCELFDDYFKNVNLHIAPGTMYSAGVRSDELQLVWTQVTTCIKEGSWKAIYASSDEEFDKIVADMVAQANEYGYDQCVEFQENEVTLRAAAEDAARAGEVVE